LNFIDSFNLLQVSLHQAKQSPIPLTIADETLQKLVQDIHTHTNRATISVSFSTNGMVPNSSESIRRMFSQPNGRVTSSEDLRELRNTLHSITVDSLHDSCISDTAQSVWNFMHVIKINASEGKQTKDEMCEQNRRLLQRWATLCRMSARHSIGNFSSLIDEHPRLYRSVFLVDLTEYMISYVPATGERRAKRFGRKKQQSDEGLRKLNVKVVLMSNADEWGSFTVREDVTLKTFLSFALDVVILPSPEPTSNLKKPKKHFDSINRAIGKVLRLPIKFLESSKNFCTEVTALQARVSHFDLTSNMLGVAAPRLAFCAQLSSDDSSLLPLTGSMDKTFAQCFASVENPTNSEPLILYLYETSQQPPVIELVPSSRSLAGDRGLQINEDEAAYMSRLIIGGKEDDLLNKRIIDEMSNTVRFNFCSVLI
jgi:hypothetical protein